MHHEDIVKTTKRQKGLMRTNLGQAKERKKTYKGPHRQKVQFYRLNNDNDYYYKVYDAY